jgi:hypothetical protein
MEDNKSGNPEAEGMFNAPEDGSVNDFFDGLETQVNGGIVDQQSEQVTPEFNGPQEVVPQETTQEQTQESSNTVDWEKRYKDSSREATRMREELNRLSPFTPVLEAMETDSGLVDHVRGYFESGGKPAQSMQEKLGLDEDFVYDETEALTDPNSDSAKLKDAYTQQLVDQKVNTILQQKEQQNAQNAQQQRMKVEAEEFKTKNNMTDEQFNAMMEASKNRRMTLDDIHYLVNKDTTTANVAKSTKQDMMNQMKNVRDIPTSVGGINSPRAEKSSSDQVFDALLGSDGDIDNLFG